MSFKMSFARDFPEGDRPKPGTFFKIEQLPLNLLYHLTIKDISFAIFFEKREGSNSVQIAAEFPRTLLPRVCGWIRREYEKYAGANYRLKRGVDDQFLRRPFEAMQALYKRTPASESPTTSKKFRRI